MNFRTFSLSILVFLAACNNSDVSEGTFEPEPVVTTPLTEEEQAAAAYDAVAPKDSVVSDPSVYNTAIDGTIEYGAVDQTPSFKRHKMIINGKTVYFTASSGHLIANELDLSEYPEGSTAGGHPRRAAVFYTAYTRDDLPRDKRPVTFLWNGGPGSASIWLHMGSWAPKRLKSDAPNIPESDYAKQPESFPFIDNEITLLDQSDLVFVDPPGTGLSTAITPQSNGEFWGTDIDASIVAGFITQYNNVNNRQSSPKYLYGESYGGIRTPIVANLLEQAGTTRFGSDKSGKPPVVLSGFILNSPLVDYNSACGFSRFSGVPASCAGYLPSYAMTADYFGKSTKRQKMAQEKYLRTTEQFTADKYSPVIDTWLKSASADDDWTAFIATLPGKVLLDELSGRTGLEPEWWAAFPNMEPRLPRYGLMPGYLLGRFDARMKVPVNDVFETVYDPDDYIDVAFENQFKTYLPDFVNYHPASEYALLNDEIIANWAWRRAGANLEFPQSITDIQAAITQDPSLKLLILHGYEDVATPGYQTELDLQGVNLSDRIPVKWFEGGHMIYNSEVSRGPLKTVLDDYYKAPPYDPLNPPIAAAASAMALN